MRWLKIISFIFGVFLLQTVILPRLNFFGVIPDLILILVVIFSAQVEGPSAVTFAAIAGALQDVFSAGPCLNVILKVIFSGVIVRVREKYLGDEQMFIYFAVAASTFIYILSEAAVYSLVFDKSAGPAGNLSFRLFVSILYNLLLTSLLLPLIRGLKP